VDKQVKRAIQEADRYVRWKKYPCLVPGCEEPAILSHAIPRASIVEALADDGIVYSLQQSFNSLMRIASPYDPMDVVRVGVNYASVFKGFCSQHDARLFAPAESTDNDTKRGMFISLHLRALALEYCRKRRTADFFKRLSELVPDQQLRSTSLDTANRFELMCAIFGRVYLGSIFNLMRGSPVDQIEYVCVPFSRNLMVSCCGVFTEKAAAIGSSISYNLISYAKISIFVLTISKTAERYLDSFLAAYPLPKDGERLINDIALSKGEEPLIAARLWHALSDAEKLEISLSLRPPFLRANLAAPRIIKVSENDFVSKITPEIVARLPAKLFERINARDPAVDPSHLTRS
jgi:hypothetical protein